MNKFVSWLVYSSEYPENFSLTLKGAIATLLPVVLLLASQLGFSLDGANVEALVLSVITIATTAVTLFGLVRKLVNTFKEKEVVTFVKAKKK
jgi:hypothetical protein